VVRPGEGQRLDAPVTSHKVWSEWYAGGPSILEGVIRPGSLIPPQVAVGSIRKTGWSAGSGSSCMERTQLQVIVLA